MNTTKTGKLICRVDYILPDGVWGLDYHIENGESFEPKHFVNIEDLAALIIGTRDRHGLRRAVIVGCDSDKVISEICRQDHPKSMNDTLKRPLDMSDIPMGAWGTAVGSIRDIIGEDYDPANVSHNRVLECLLGMKFPSV